MRWIFFILVLFSVSSSLFAHPHCFIDYTLTSQFDSDGLIGFKTQWIFDEMFSEYVRTYDENEDGKFTDEELIILKKEAFDNLKDYDYFTRIYVDAHIFKVNFIKDFKAWFEGDKVAYEYFIPCHVTGLSSDKHICFMVFDPTYYIHVDPAQNTPMAIEGGEDYVVKQQVVERKQDAYYQGMIIPFAYQFSFRKK